jgi:H+/gluconate symporter-like permease
VHRWLKHYGFALLVFVALACASFLAGSAAIPEPVPDYALQAEEIYRLEIGAAFFVAFYLAVMAVVLAFSGKGFAEFGTRGLKAEAVIVRREQKETSQQMLEELRKARSDMEDQNGRIKSYEQRLKKLESELLP